MKILLILAIAMAGGLALSRLMKLLNLPNVTGYLIAGILIGPFVLKLVTNVDIKSAKIITTTALGFIAFSIGGEFKLSLLKKLGGKIVVITVVQAVMTVLLVLLALLLVPGEYRVPRALLLGAIAAATAPAATLLVVRQYKAKGPVTDTLLPVTAFDDAVGLMIFSLCFALAQAFASGDALTVQAIVLDPLREIGLSLLTGGVMGAVLAFVMRFFKSKANRLCLMLAAVFACVALSEMWELSSLLTYSFMMLNSLMMLSMVFVMITMAGESGKRIAEVLEEKSTLSNPENPVYEVKDGSISFEHVSFKYAKEAKRRVLKNIDLDIRSGETIGIIGGTGSSKSSLIQLISRLYDVTEGAVKVGGVDVRDYDLETLRNQVAVVLQKNILFSGTIRDNLRWGNKEATDEELVQACKMACADEFISQFPDGYDTYIEQGGANVSGGQKQRLCIARALLKKPKILILDDSTSAVDTRTDARIRKAMKDYIPETTKIIIAQRTASVEDADRIIVMEGGEINAIGTHEELLASNEIYREIYTSQNKEGNQLGE